MVAIITLVMWRIYKFGVFLRIESCDLPLSRRRKKCLSTWSVQLSEHEFYITNVRDSIEEYFDSKQQRASERRFIEQISIAFLTRPPVSARREWASSADSSGRGMGSRVARTGCTIVQLIARCRAVRTVGPVLELHLSLRERKQEVKKWMCGCRNDIHIRANKQTHERDPWNTWLR
jgi:hypothetical protein